MAPTTRATRRRLTANADGGKDDKKLVLLQRRRRLRKKYKSVDVLMRTARNVEFMLLDDDDDDHHDFDQMMKMNGGGGGGKKGKGKGKGKEKGKDYYRKLSCEKCGLGDKAEEILICDKCDKGFHMLCLRPIVVRVPIGSWYCSKCCGHNRHSPRVKRFSQMKIIDFFGIQKCTEPLENFASALDVRKRRKRFGSLVFYKKRRKLLPFVPAEEADQRIKQMASLASALTAMKIKFSSELNYMPGMAPRSANRAKFENGGMQLLSKEDLETVNYCKAMGKRGLCPPLIVAFDSCEGYTVQADGPIKDMTFIAEYAGDVDYLKKREHDDCDSLMTLLSAKNPAKSLVICPDKHGNIARFINGINNHLLGSKKKQNLKCVRYDVNGECRVLLVATRDIAKGERLYYDYNGHEFEYPTHHFI